MDLEGPALQSLVRSARKQIRSRMQALRLAVPAAARARRDGAIIERVLALEEVINARSIALFAPMESKGEIALAALDAHARAEGRRLFYPRLSHDRRDGGDGASLDGELAEAALTELVPSGAGFLEPPPAATPAVRGAVDVIVVPALAVAVTGHRLGYGSGFYDRLLPAHCPPATAVVVAYDFQFVGELPVLEWDVPCPIVVTDTRTVRVPRQM